MTLSFSLSFFYRNIIEFCCKNIFQNWVDFFFNCRLCVDPEIRKNYHDRIFSKYTASFFKEMCSPPYCCGVLLDPSRLLVVVLFVVMCVISIITVDCPYLRSISICRNFSFFFLCLFFLKKTLKGYGGSKP